MKKINLFINLTFCIFLIFSYSLTMANEEVKYNIVHKTDVYEIREYSDRLVVQAAIYNDGGTFRKLFNYISGANKSSEKIEMTRPVTQIKKDNLSFMQFYLPSKFNKITTPIPSNPDVKIKLIKKGHFAVIRYSGRSSDKNFSKHSKILYNELLEDKILINGLAIKATYNSPFTPPPLRRNEVMFSVKWES